MDAKEYILNYFEQKGGIPGDSEEEKLSVNYLDVKIIDSMGLIELIGDIETQFDIRLSSDELESDAFQNIAGLIAIIDKLRK